MRQLRLKKRPPAPSEQKILSRQPATNDAVMMCAEAWSALNTCRPTGFGVGPIPFTAVLAWAQFKRLDRELTELLLGVVQRLDRDFLEAQAAKAALR